MRRLERLEGDLFGPAARLHRVEHDLGRMAGGGLRDDPAAQLGGDDLGTHRPRFCRSEKRP